MRTIQILAAIGGLCFSTCLIAQSGAAIEFKFSSTKGANGTVKIAVSDLGSVSDFSVSIPQMPGGGFVNKSLYKKSSPDMTYSIDDKNKTYTERKKQEAASEDSKTYTVTKLGNEKLNGYNCVHATMSDGKENYEVWNTKDVSEFDKYSEAFRLNNRTGSQKRQDALKSAGCDGFPVKTLHKGNEREGDVSMELVKIEKKSFASSDFEIPAGYTKSEGASAGPGGMRSQQEIMKMSPEERAKYIEEMKKKYGR